MHAVSIGVEGLRNVNSNGNIVADECAYDITLLTIDLASVADYLVAVRAVRSRLVDVGHLSTSSVGNLSNHFLVAQDLSLQIAFEILVSEVLARSSERHSSLQCTVRIWGDSQVLGSLRRLVDETEANRDGVEEEVELVGIADSVDTDIVVARLLDRDSLSAVVDTSIVSSKLCRLDNGDCHGLSRSILTEFHLEALCVVRRVSAHVDVDRIALASLQIDGRSDEPVVAGIIHVVVVVPVAIAIGTPRAIIAVAVNHGEEVNVGEHSLVRHLEGIAKHLAVGGQHRSVVGRVLSNDSILIECQVASFDCLAEGCLSEVLGHECGHVVHNAIDVVGQHILESAVDTSLGSFPCDGSHILLVDVDSEVLHEIRHVDANPCTYACNVRLTGSVRENDGEVLLSETVGSDCAYNICTGGSCSLSQDGTILQHLIVHIASELFAGSGGGGNGEGESTFGRSAVEYDSQICSLGRSALSNSCRHSHQTEHLTHVEALLRSSTRLEVDVVETCLHGVGVDTVEEESIVGGIDVTAHAVVTAFSIGECQTGRTDERLNTVALVDLVQVTVGGNTVELTLAADTQSSVSVLQGSDVGPGPCGIVHRGQHVTVATQIQELTIDDARVGILGCFESQVGSLGIILSELARSEVDGHPVVSLEDAPNKDRATAVDLAVYIG